MKPVLFGKSLNELTETAIQLGLPKFTGRQIAEWLYQKDVCHFAEMTNLSKKARALLEDHTTLGLQAPTRVQTSLDGTKKYLFPTSTDKFIETAMIPSDDRVTVCVSSQIGCKMGCLFCMTGKQGFQGQVSAGEIVNQVRSIAERHGVTNLVYMGMGEPFDNLDEVLKSIEVFTSDWGFAMSPRRITVSSVGLTPGLIRFLRESEAHLAISVHTPFHDERQQLMPVQIAYPLEEVIAEIKQWDFSGQRRVSFEYIVFGGLNDTARHVKQLSRLLAGIRCRINLIRFHPIPGSPLAGTDEKTLEWFKDELNKKGIITTIRTSRGLDIYAACGLLSTKAMGLTQE
ncbi:MAG: 23S rRNA (adenine(2503)-C(2))-methyltransferase RlmN [Phycisphaeraceae bacterium]|nr:23S rRNA (adenine(2503)-C(2))-methyltransferase RlmN [Phycisphaeraceae bacterium]